MRKTLIGCMVATALATVSSAHAQVFSYSFTDTNKAVRNIKPATQTYLNPAGVLTLNLISGLDRYERVTVTRDSDKKVMYGLAPIFPYTFYHLTHYWFAAADIPVANDTPVHYADAIRCNVRRPPQGSLPLLTRRVSA